MLLLPVLHMLQMLLLLQVHSLHNSFPQLLIKYLGTLSPISKRILCIKILNELLATAIGHKKPFCRS